MATVEQGSSLINSSTQIQVNLLPYSILGNGVQTVTTAGTAVQLAGSNAIKSITIRAKVSNTGLIYVGTSSVSSSNGFQLSAAETVSLDIANISTIWIDSSVNGEGVTYIYLS